MTTIALCILVFALTYPIGRFIGNKLAQALHMERRARARYMRWVFRQDADFQAWHRKEYPERHDSSFLA